MPRITVRVDDETAEWLEAEADRLDRSKAKTGGRCIELLHGELDHISPQHFDAGADINLKQPDSGRVDELAQTVADLEARVSELEAEQPRHAHASASDDAPDDQCDASAQESLSAPSSASQHTPDAGGSGEAERGVAVTADSVRAQAEQRIDDMDIPGSGAVQRNRRDALLWAWDYLRQEEKAQSSQIANATYGAFWDRDLDYGVQSQYPGRGLWQLCLRDRLRELPGVDAPPSRGRTWEFVDD